jgi:hypothetical protein
VLAKVTAMGILMSTIIFGPPLLLFLGLTFSDDSPLTYLVDHINDLFKIASYGIIVSVFFGAISLAIATFTTRKGIAAAIFIIGTLMLQGIAEGFFEAIADGRWRGFLLFISPRSFVDALRRWMFRNEQQTEMFQAVDLPGAVTLLWLVFVVAASTYFIYRTYLRED